MPISTAYATTTSWARLCWKPETVASASPDKIATHLIQGNILNIRMTSLAGAGMSHGPPHSLLPRRHIISRLPPSRVDRSETGRVRVTPKCFQLGTCSCMPWSIGSTVRVAVTRIEACRQSWRPLYNKQGSRLDVPYVPYAATASRPVCMTRSLG